MWFPFNLISIFGFTKRWLLWIPRRRKCIIKEFRQSSYESEIKRLLEELIPPSKILNFLENLNILNIHKMLTSINKWKWDSELKYFTTVLCKFRWWFHYLSYILLPLSYETLFLSSCDGSKNLYVLLCPNLTKLPCCNIVVCWIRCPLTYVWASGWQGVTDVTPSEPLVMTQWRGWMWGP